MIKPYLDRSYTGVLCGVYQNLNTLEWSVRALEGPDKGKKVAEGDSVTLVDCVPFVREPTRARLVAARLHPGAGKGAKGHKEVHAWIAGYVVPDDVIPPHGGGNPIEAHRVTYRPFDRADFYYPASGETFTGAPVVTFWHDRCAYVAGYADSRAWIRKRCGI